jgi:hypothetical protein
VSRNNFLPYVTADYLRIIIHTVTNHVLYTLKLQAFFEKRRYLEALIFKELS